MMGQQQTLAGSTLVRRMVLALAIAAVITLSVMASAVPAGAVSDKGKGQENANVIGTQTSGVNVSDPQPGRGGTDVTSERANPKTDPDHTPGIGDIATGKN
jgi:hypothetical protein